MRPELLLAAIRELAGTPSPRGAERALAERLAAWAGRRWPDLGWVCEPVGEAGANLVASSGDRERWSAPIPTSCVGRGPELLLYSHLDTSLSGDPVRDRPATGLPGPIAPLSVDEGGAIAGFGLGVAKAPAAAVLVGYVAAATALRASGSPHRLTLLLAGGGTHRSPFGGEPVTGSGVDHHLRRHPRPAAAVVAKSGPGGILLAEPGAMFVRVRLTAQFLPVLARDAAAPDGGLLAHLGTAVRAIEDWRADHLAARAGDGPVAAEAGIGAVCGGLPGKPDLLPGSVDLHLYVVTVPGDDAGAIAADLRRRFDGRIPGCAVAVDAHLVHPAGATPADAPIARHAAAAWTAAHGTPPPAITGWKGSTDGATLRAHGVDTVRLGPPVGRDPADPRRDVVTLPDLTRYANLYADIALRHAAG